MRLPSVSSSRYIGTRFLANARNDRILNLLMLSFRTNPPSGGGVRNRVSRMADEFTEGNLQKNKLNHGKKIQFIYNSRYSYE
jgi:hypothetical protein